MKMSDSQLYRLTPYRSWLQTVTLYRIQYLSLKTVRCL